MRDLGSIPGLGRSPGKGKGYPLQYSGQENSVDYIVHGVAKRRTRLSDLLSHTEAQDLVEVNLPAILVLFGLVLSCLYSVLRLCHCFKGCVLPSCFTSNQQQDEEIHRRHVVGRELSCPLVSPLPEYPVQSCSTWRLSELPLSVFWWL